MAEGIVLKEGHMAIEGTTGYAITRTGEVWSYRSFHGGFVREPRVLTARLEKGSLVVKGAPAIFVADAVAAAFIGKRPSAAHTLSYIDGDPANASADNIKWTETAPAYGAKEVPSCPGYYVTRDGEMWTTLKRSQSRFAGAWFCMKPSLRSNGYLGFNVAGRVRYLHELVLETWRCPRPEGLQGCHEDGNKHRNCIDNLRWDTPAGNTADKLRHGTVPNGERIRGAKLTAEKVLEMRRLHSEGMRAKDLAPMFGIEANHCAGILRGRFWKHLAPAPGGLE